VRWSVFVGPSVRVCVTMKLSLDVTNSKSDKEEEYALTVEMSYNHRV
jgi:hypothetical protein